MTFRDPELLWLLLALPPVALLFFATEIGARRRLRAFVGHHARVKVLGRVLVASFAEGVLTVLSIGALVLALAGPAWGEMSLEDDRRGLEIVIVVDVSNSMVAEDVAPSRLARTREVARVLVGRLPDAHVAIVAFAGAATTLVPMTDDPVSVELALANLSPMLLTTPGTNVAGAVETALEAFSGTTPRRQVIVLFSDGEQLTGDRTAALDSLEDADVPLFAVAAGTPGGATIPLEDGGVLTDANGAPVIARVDREFLRSLAQSSGGRMVSLSDAAVVAELAEDLDQISGRSAPVMFRTVSLRRDWLFILLAVVSMVGAIAVRAFGGVGRPA